MKAFQCSKCIHLVDFDETCSCQIDIDPRPKYRDKGDVALCREKFKQIEQEWHKSFYWERG